MKSQIENYVSALAEAKISDWDGQSMFYVPALDFGVGSEGFFQDFESALEFADSREVGLPIEAFLCDGFPPQTDTVEDIVENITQDSHECCGENILSLDETEVFRKALDTWYEAIAKHQECLTYQPDHSRKMIIQWPAEAPHA